VRVRDQALSTSCRLVAATSDICDEEDLVRSQPGITRSFLISDALTSILSLRERQTEPTLEKPKALQQFQTAQIFARFIEAAAAE
jgi:hypothetical protein